MSTSSLTDFFSGNVAHPNSIPFRQNRSWDDSNTPAFSITPAATETIYINYFNVITKNPDDQDFLSSNKQMHLFMVHDNPPGDPIDIVFDTFTDRGGDFGSNDLFGGAMTLLRLASDPNIWSAQFKFSPPICLTGDTESFNFRGETSIGSVSSDILSPGSTIRYSVQGWVLLTADL